MNLTIIGLIGGVLFIVISCFLAGSLKAFFDIPSLVIVLGGTIASTCVAFPAESMKNFLKTFKLLFKKEKTNIKPLIDELVKYSEMVKKDSRLALEKIQVKDPFMKRGFDCILSNTHPTTIASILEMERDAFMEKELENYKILDKMGELAPAWGMIGTLIGLVVMMLSLDDPSSIGPSMAIALITTFYGAVFANLIFMPLSNVAELKATAKDVIRGIQIEGIKSLAQEEGPRMMESRLYSFIHHDEEAKNLLKIETAGKSI